ncbi:MAG: glutathione peroxidase, partial [Olleya sp.]
EKIDVKGHNQHPLYAWLTQQQKNGKSNSSVKWNFQKYIVSPDGQLLDYLYSTSNPNSSKITKYLK